MKTFKQFIIEASNSTLQATRLGYVGDGHGGWYNRATGEFEAKTVGGQLQFYNKRQVAGGKDPKQTEFEKRIPLGTKAKARPQFTSKVKTELDQQVPQQTQQVPQQQIPQEQPTYTPPVVEKNKGTLTIAFGRFNPPTYGHSELMDAAANMAMQNGEDYLIFPSRSHDPKKNPLDPDTKIGLMRKLYPNHSERIVNDSNVITIFDALKKAHNDGYSNVRIVSGPDRVKEFEKLSNTYNGQLYQFDGIEVVPSGQADADGKNMDQLSSSRMRLAAAEGDFTTFRSGLPKGVRNKEALKLFNMIRQGMNIQDIQQEGYNTWEIAPEYDLQTLRENYISKTIFREGDYIESLNTGLIGKIIRRGTNYLICVTESGMMFKSWIKDVKESYQETSMSRMKRLPKNMFYKTPEKPNNLVGTTGYFLNAAKMTPGAIGTNSEYLQIGGVPYGTNLINKDSKR